MDTPQNADAISGLLPVTFTVEGISKAADGKARTAAWKSFTPRRHWIAYAILGGLAGGLSQFVKEAWFYYGFWSALGLFVVELSIVNGAQNASRRGAADRCYPVTYTIDSSGISSACASSSTTASWGAFRSVVQTPQELILILNSGGTYVFPKEALPEHPAYYADEIKRKIAAA